MTAQRHVAAVVALAITLASVTSVLADEAATTTSDSLVGSRVRIEQRVGLGSTSRMQGTLLGVEGNYLLLRREGAPVEDVKVPISQVDRVEAYRRTRSGTRAGRGAAIGAVIGAAGGYFVGHEGIEYGGDDAAYWRGRFAIGGALALGTVGAGIGALIGSRSTVGDWKTVPKPRIRPVVAIVPHRNGVRMALAFSY